MKKKDIYVQKEISSCGACSIASVVSHYDGYVPLETILDDTLTDRNGTNAYQIARVLKKYGFNSYGLNIELSKINKTILPVIAHVKRNGYEHFLVIYKITDDSVLTMDPEVGKKVYKVDEFKDMFDNVIITCTPATKIIHLEERKTLSKYFKEICSSYKKRFNLLIFISLIMILLSITGSFYIKIGSLLKLNDLCLITLLFSFILIIKYIIFYIKSYMQSKIGMSIDINVHSKFIKHIFKLKLKYINNKRVGEIVKKINNMSSIKEVFMRVVLINSIDVLFIIFGLLILLVIGPFLTLFIFVSMLVYGLISYLASVKIYKLESANIEKQNVYSGNLVEYLNGLESIKNLNEEDLFLGKIDESFDYYMKDSLKMSKYNIKLATIKNFIKELTFILNNFIGFYLILNGEFTLINLITFNGIISLVYDSLDSILNTLPSISYIRAIYREISEFLDIDEELSGSTLKVSSNALNVSNLTYSYDYYHDIIKNINLEINKGDKLLINGPSGMGKSTLVKCISRTIDDYNGSITLDGIDIKDIPVNLVRKQIIYVSQNEILFNMSIKNNICLNDYEEEKLNKVIDVCKLDGIIQKRSNGIDTVVLEGGTNLSGGERARIVLARALYKCPSILILDEILSSVGETLENEILNNLFELKDLTLIYITHRDKRTLFPYILDFRKDGNYEIIRK